MSTSSICCPQCHTILDINGPEGEFACPNCGYRYAVKDGIIDFAPENHFYWGEVTQEDMWKVNAQAETEGWFPAFVENIVGANKRDMAKYLLDPVRIAGLFHYYNPNKKEVCVDLGSGWGPIAFGLSKFYDTVYSMDGVYERMRFQAIRAKQDGIENVKILKGGLTRLPLSDNSADVVIVNGLLEWIGLSDEVTEPRTLQINFLKEVRRILKPGGKLFIGIENRVGAQYFLGSRDHSGLRFTSLMPRWLASRVVQRSRRMDESSYFSGAEHSYRTLTYTYWGYLQLLQETGFVKPEMYWAWPSYNEPHASGTLDGQSIGFYLNTVQTEITDPKRRLLLDMVGALPRPMLSLLIKSFSPHFLIVTGKGELDGGIQKQALGKQEPKNLLRTSLTTWQKFDADYQVLNQGKVEKDVSVTPHVDGTGAAFEIKDQGGITGRPLHHTWLTDMRRVADWLGHFQQQSDQGELTLADQEQEIARLVENARRLIPEVSELLEDYTQAYLSALSGCRLAKVQEHGQFIPQNIHIQRDGSVEVKGWENGKTFGSPLLDAGAYLLSIETSSKSAQMAFKREYNRWIDWPLSLAPAYYILRVLQQDFHADGVTPDNYLGIVYWRPRLIAALESGIGVMDREARQVEPAL